MKKTAVLLAIVVILAGILPGCGSTDGTAVGRTPVFLTLATGGTAGIYFPFGEALAKVFNSKAGVQISVQATDGSVENLQLVNRRDAELAIVQTDMMDYAYNGRETFKEKMTTIRGISILYPEIIQIVVQADSNINSIADLKGKKVGIGAPGSGTEANFRQLAAIYELDYKAFQPLYLSFAASAAQFKEKSIDAFILVSASPSTIIQDIAAHQKIKILSMSDADVTKINRQYPYLAPVTIPANTYKGQTAAVRTVAVQAALIAGSQVPEDVVYNMTRSLFESQAELVRLHSKGKELSLEKATRGMSIPLHPGAIKYYKEKGVY